MTQEQPQQVILEKIKNLHHEMTKGFEGVHERQDKTNGRIASAEGEIIELKIQDAKIVSKLKNERIIWTLLVALVGILAGLVGRFLG